MTLLQRIVFEWKRIRLERMRRRWHAKRYSVALLPRQQGFTLLELN